MDGVRKRLNRYFWLLSLISQGETDLYVWFGQVPILLTFIQAWDQHWEYASFCPLLSNRRSFASKVNMFTTKQANQSNVCNQLDQASSHSSPNDTWTHEVHRALGYLCVFVCVHLFLTFSTSLMTRSRLFPRAALTSSSVHPLLSSSATKLGTLDTSSKPSGTLKGQIYNQRVTCDVKLSGFFLYSTSKKQYYI